MNPVFRASTASLMAVIFSSTSLTIGCNSAKTADSTTTGPAQTQAASNPASQPVAQMSLDDLVAPIALYPDQLLGQILATSMNSQEVLDLGNWILQNQNLQGDALTNAAKTAGFSPSAQYLVAFPQVVDNMCQQMDWTKQLGEAFQSDQKGVMDAVQRKRSAAQQMGNLASTPQMTVATQTDNGQQYVEIKPADPKVVYVPQYNPVTIYNTQAPAAPAQTTTAETSKSGVSTGGAVAIGLLSFGTGMLVGSAISNNNDYYPYPSWGSGGMYYGGRPYYPPPYRPAYAGYHPAYGYNPPNNYHWNQYNKNVNVNVNNNYYGKFNNTNVNTRPGGSNNQYAGANNRPGSSTNSNWKGQSTYQGARPNATNQGPGSNVNRSNNRNEQQLANRPTTQAASRPNIGNNNAAPANRSNMANNSGPANRPNGGANSGPTTMAAARDMSPPTSGGAASASRAAAPSNPNKGGDRGYSAPASRPTPAAPPSRPSPSSSPQAQNRSAPSGGAFGGGSSAKADNAASNRGRSSMGASGGGGAGGRKR
jgi:hypothetical protein